MAPAAVGGAILGKVAVVAVVAVDMPRPFSKSPEAKLFSLSLVPAGGEAPTLEAAPAPTMGKMADRPASAGPLAQPAAMGVLVHCRAARAIQGLLEVALVPQFR